MVYRFNSLRDFGMLSLPCTEWMVSMLSKHGSIGSNDSKASFVLSQNSSKTCMKVRGSPFMTGRKRNEKT
jgi:hypothetical protein